MTTKDIQTLYLRKQFKCRSLRDWHSHIFPWEQSYRKNTLASCSKFCPTHLSLPSTTRAAGGADGV